MKYDSWSTFAVVSAMPRPEMLLIAKQLAIQEVMVSGTVAEIWTWPSDLFVLIFSEKKFYTQKPEILVSKKILVGIE